MGSLKDVGFLQDDGKLTDTQQLQTINEICNFIKNAPPISIAGVSFPLKTLPVPAAADVFAPNEGLDAHKEKFNQWHVINLDIFLSGVTTLFDSIPTIGVAAKAIPIVDPTQPIIDILNQLKDLFPDLIDFDVINFLVENIVSIFLQIPLFLSKIALLAADIIEGVASKISDAIEVFIDFIKDNIIEKFDKTSRQISEIKSKIDDLLQSSASFTRSVAEKIRDLALKIISFPSLPNLSIELPNFDFSLAFPDINLPMLPIFHIGFPPGIAYFFIEFIKRLIQGIITLLGNIADLIAAFLQGITAVIKYLVQSIFNIIVQILNTLIPDISKAVTLAGTIAIFAKKITQMAIVSIIGWLVGPGIIINVAAREVGLVA